MKINHISLVNIYLGAPSYLYLREKLCEWVVNELYSFLAGIPLLVEYILR